jgi:hypothetical protein
MSFWRATDRIEGAERAFMPAHQDQKITGFSRRGDSVRDTPEQGVASVIRIPGKALCMCHLRKRLIAVTFLVTTGAVQSARASEPPADLCSLLPVAEVSKTLGQTYAPPQTSVAPRPFANTNTGTDCKYRSKDGSTLWFRAYVDPSPSAAADLFAQLSKFYGPPTPIKGLGDEAYFDADHALHARKGKVRFYINLAPLGTFTPSREKQLKDLASGVAGRL